MSFILGLGAALLGTAFGQEGVSPGADPRPLPTSRPCLQGDLTGLWTSDRSMGEGAPGAAPLQPRDYIRVVADGEMVYFASANQALNIGEVDQKLDDIDQIDGVTFRVSIIVPGNLIIDRDGAPVEGFLCTVARDDPYATETIWTQLPGRPPVYRHNELIRK